MPVREFRDTPNPNAVKCLLDRSIGEGMRSYFNATQAAGDPVAERLFAIDGVTNVLIHGDWLTVGKRPDAPWGPIRKAVEGVLRGPP
jgi:hypothetical protein